MLVGVQEESAVGMDDGEELSYKAEMYACLPCLFDSYETKLTRENLPA